MYNFISNMNRINYTFNLFFKIYNDSIKFLSNYCLVIHYFDFYNYITFIKIIIFMI